MSINPPAPSRTDFAMKHFTLLFSLCFATLLPVNADDRAPNIIFIMADDLGYGDLGCYGQKLIKTPNIDRLATEGIRFTQAYAGGSVCTPSRSVLMTGLHAGHTVARDNVPHYPTYLEDDDVTVAEVLSEAGYRCGGLGKWSLGDAGTAGRATNQGFNSWFGYLNQDHAHYYWPEYLDDDEDRVEFANNTDLRSHYSHDVMTEHALDFIQESKDKPFFYYAAYTLPHFSSKEEDKDGLAIPSTDPYTDRDWEEKAKKYAAMIDRLDRDVGRIVAQVERLGLSKKTLIIFTSDNGGHSTVAKRFNTSGPLRGLPNSPRAKLQRVSMGYPSSAHSRETGSKPTGITCIGTMATAGVFMIRRCDGKAGKESGPVAMRGASNFTISKTTSEKWKTSLHNTLTPSKGLPRLWIRQRPQASSTPSGKSTKARRSGTGRNTAWSPFLL